MNTRTKGWLGGLRVDIVEYAKTQGQLATSVLSKGDQKALGQFMTPPNVARYMAQRCMPLEGQSVIRILEPAAGAGILVAAVVEAILNGTSLPDKIQVTLFEIDSRLIGVLRKLAGFMRKKAKSRGTHLTVSIHNEDFLLSHEAVTQNPIADIIISNPPYFKISASDSRALTHPYAVYGQPNIYGLFMAACAGLLAPAGRWCFITPRSWTNGLYFSAMRRHVFRCLHIDAMHLFESRKDHFNDDEILQEAMITWATAQPHPYMEVVVSSSEGSRDIADARLLRLPTNQVIGRDDAEMMIVLPASSSGDSINQWPATLATYGLKVSTGPVVAFRAKKHICENATGSTVPLLWMQHINHMQITWPINKKREHIVASAETAWMLVQNANMVVMRRFSPKEDERRVKAAPYVSRKLPGAMIGLENHTNYIYRPGGVMTAHETRGLAAYLNSRVVDQYLRTVAGNTQVNATDLRKLPLPPAEIIMRIGASIRMGMTLQKVDAVVEHVLGDTENHPRAAGDA